MTEGGSNLSWGGGLTAGVGRGGRDGGRTQVGRAGAEGEAQKEKDGDLHGVLERT